MLFTSALDTTSIYSLHLLCHCIYDSWVSEASTPLREAEALSKLLLYVYVSSSERDLDLVDFALRVIILLS